MFNTKDTVSVVTSITIEGTHLQTKLQKLAKKSDMIPDKIYLELLEIKEKLEKVSKRIMDLK